MAEIVLKSIGTNKVKVIKVYREVTGTDLKEAKEAVDSVEQGEEVIISGIAPSDILNVIQRFREEGAIASEINALNINNVPAYELNNIDGKVQETIEQHSIQEKSVVKNQVSKSVELGVDKVDIDNVVGRKETLSVLDDVLKVSRQIDIIMVKIKKIDKEIEEIKKEADNILNRMSPVGKKVWMAMTVIFALIGFFSFPNRLIAAIVMGGMGGVFSWLVVKTPDDIIFGKQKQANKENYLAENLSPKLDEQKTIQEEAELYLSSNEVLWAIDVIGNEYFNTMIIQKIYDLVNSRRADSLKEALNLYETIKYQENMQSMQNSILELSQVSAAAAKEQAEYARKQAEYAKQTEKNTRSAANTAKVNAVINYGTYKNVKDINKKM